VRIAVFGATGDVGRRVVAEALSRGHEVTAMARDLVKLKALPANVIARSGDVGNVDDVAALSADQDVVISATHPPPGRESEVAAMTQSLMDGMARTGVRLLVVGGAATLKVPGTGGRTVLDDSRFLPASERHIGQASVQQYAVCSAEDRVDWAYLSPPAHLVPGERTGKYRLGRDELLLDSDGNSAISMEDLAVVLLDEAERPQHHRVRFTAAY
jgi:uncharacterized protein